MAPSLFDEPDTSNDGGAVAMQALDEVNDRYGSRALRLAIESRDGCSV
ncbi:DUF4113 domain-containing protein [Prosthecochloris sp. SCSIO W1101]|nr:hypothetical protein [Prosthecochloris sp. SCSIO W1101]UZJ40528.1 DUF4113 domain-containing protein [Prosthecochloris sp. SCSIO W1101]